MPIWNPDRIRILPPLRFKTATIKPGPAYSGGVMKSLFHCSLSALMILSFGCGSTLSYQNEEAFETVFPASNKQTSGDAMNEKAELSLATFGNGCFWCTEAIFLGLRGVEKVVPGYSGGHVDNPTYEQVSTGTTGHAEAIQITYDPGVVSYDKLLEVFWRTHDPTTRNRQGNDVGPQYRSVIFYHTPEQKKLAEKYKMKLDEAGIWSRPIVTEIEAFRRFWPAEDYHRNYYANNPSNAYCRVVITPKIEKFRKVFKDLMKD